MTKEQLKKELEEKFYKWSKDGGFTDYEDHEVDTDLLWNWFDSQIDRIREDSVRGFVDYTMLGTTNDDEDLSLNNNDLKQNMDEYLKSKSGGIK